MVRRRSLRLFIHLLKQRFWCLLVWKPRYQVASVKHGLLRDKIMEQSAAFVSTYMTEYGIIVPSFVTCNLLRSADLAGKKEWKITTDSDTTWRAYQSEVKDIRNQIINCLYFEFRFLFTQINTEQKFV